MLARAEVQAGVENYDGLVLARFTFAPTGFDEQRAADFDGLEMPFLRFCPVFAPHLRNRDLPGTGFEPKIFDPLQAGGNFIADLARKKRLPTAINRDGAHTCFDVETGCSRPAKD